MTAKSVVKEGVLGGGDGTWHHDSMHIRTADECLVPCDALKNPRKMIRDDDVCARLNC